VLRLAPFAEGGAHVALRGGVRHVAARRRASARQATAAAATAIGRAVNAGHDLNVENTPLLARTVPGIVEASIGHALLADALDLGLAETVRPYVRACAGEDVDAPVTM